MSVLTQDFLKRVISPEPRLPWLTNWLLNDVWSLERFHRLAPEEYLTQGEHLVHDAEELLAGAADRFYDELASAAGSAEPLTRHLQDKKAAVIFDGASLREMPLLLLKAEESGYRVLEKRIAFAALPSETVDYIGQRVLGKVVTPKMLPQRKELRDQNIKAFYFNDAISSQSVNSDEGEGLLLWSAFPDCTYKDSSARFARHFSEMFALYDAAWKHTVMQVPRGRRIIVTSDHGYIFFGAGFDSTRPDDACALLDHNRFKVFADGEPMPDASASKDLQIFPDTRLAMIRGRLKNRPKGHAANRIYRHGGLSLMEMLVPWIVLEKE